MDRGTKLMFGMLTAAVCLMVIMMISREAPQAHADMYRGDTGGEPTIISFRVVSCGSVDSPHHFAYRMWSDGSIEWNHLGRVNFCGGAPQYGGAYMDNNYNANWCDNYPIDGWHLVTDSVAGFRCAGDTDGNRDVDIEDLLSVINDYGACEQDPPLNLPPDSDQ